MASIEQSSQPDYQCSSHSSPTASPKTLLSSTQQILEQPLPPTLREILNAYHRGGDRDMMLAMLMAKSAEEMRITTIAALHRSLLDTHGAVQKTSDQQIQHTPHPETRPRTNTLPPLRLPNPTHTFPPPQSSHSEARFSLQREAPVMGTFATQSRKRSRISPPPCVRLTHPLSHDRDGPADHSPPPPLSTTTKMTPPIHASYSKHADIHRMPSSFPD